MKNIDVIDFHCHILPGIDDGAQDVETSRKMLRAMADYGCRHIVATPHFYPEYDNPDDFIERRNHAAALLDTDMQITLGAEVAYFFGISKSKETGKLRIGDTDYILIEMPFEPWTSQQLDEVISLQRTHLLTPILAHTERYLKWQDRGVWHYLKDNDVLFQSNADFFAEHPLTAKIRLKSGFIDLLGTDSHNMTTRKPNLDEALKSIDRHFLEEIIENGNAVFS